LEFRLASFGKTSLNAMVGFGYVSYVSYSGSYMFPIGLNVVYGNKRHFAEAGARLTWIPVNGDIEGDFFTLQPEIGYRINLGKRFLARLAYTPYWWLADKKGREHIVNSFVHSVSVGVGVRFH
jgi:hypothetical protein